MKGCLAWDGKDGIAGGQGGRPLKYLIPLRDGLVLVAEENGPRHAGQGRGGPVDAHDGHVAADLHVVG